MRILRGFLCLALAQLLAAQPLLAQVAKVAVPTGQGTAAPSSAAGGALGQAQALEFRLPVLTLGSSAGLQPSLPALTGAPSLSGGLGMRPVSPAIPVAHSMPALLPAAPASLPAARSGAPVAGVLLSPLAGASVPEAPLAAESAVAERIGRAVVAVAQSSVELERARGDGVSAAASRQFAALVGDDLLAGSAFQAEPADGDVAAAGAGPSLGLKAATKGVPEAGQDIPPAKPRLTQVFKDPERNRSFWRYLWGYTVSLFGLKMYVVGLPYLISSLTKNSLGENNDPRAGSAEIVKSLIRENRSLARIAHWTAQAVSYISIPFFTRDAQEGPRKWYVRSAFLRGAVLALIPALFLASGLFSVQGALLALFGLIAAQSFFQGIYCTMDKASVAAIMGDKSVTASERVRANAILTFAAAAVSIIAPAIGGQLSLVRDFFGKTGVGGPVIYAIYAVTTALSGLFFAAISIIGRKAAPGTAGEENVLPAAEGEGRTGKGFLGSLKGLWTSLREGLGLIVRNPVLRTMLGLNLITFLFSDPLTFSVLPEFAEGIVKSQQGVGALLGIPVLGWLIKGLTSTPMGYFGLMAAMASVGSMAATLLMDPLRKLFQRLGFKSEEALTTPFVLIAALEIPLFWLMIHTGSLAGAVALFALQAFSSGFAGVMLASVSQKAMGSFDRSQVNKIIATQSLLQIAAAIAATCLYGFVLTGVPLATLLTVAAVSVTVLGLARAAAPWLLFRKG